MPSKGDQIKKCLDHKLDQKLDERTPYTYVLRYLHYFRF